MDPPSRTNKARGINVREYLPLLLMLVAVAVFVAIIVVIIVHMNSLAYDAARGRLFSED